MTTIHDVRRVFEGIAVEERDVAVLARFERAHALVDADDPRRIDGDRRQRLLERQASRRGESRFEQHDARLGHVALVAALQSRTECRPSSASPPSPC